jgi:hypothetical protein
VNNERRSVLTLVTGSGHAGASAPSPDDPIYGAIEKHKAAGIVWGAAVTVRSDFPDLNMTPEQRRQKDLLDADERGAWKLLSQAGIDLLNTKPTTLAGIIVAIQYIRFQMTDDGTYMPHHLKYDHGGDAQDTMGWIDAFLATLAGAAAALARQEGNP